MQRQRIDTSEFTGYIDTDLKVLMVIYHATISSQTTAELYAWIQRITANATPEDTTIGGIFDFREVKEFVSGNLSSVQRRSTDLNRKVDTSSYPVALLVSTLYQEQLVRAVMKSTPGQDRKKIVRSLEDAMTFLKTFHEKRLTSEHQAVSQDTSSVSG
jgi:hypothetical protein